jgi:hypothetical protein
MTHKRFRAGVAILMFFVMVIGMGLSPHAIEWALFMCFVMIALACAPLMNPFNW